MPSIAWRSERVDHEGAPRTVPHRAASQANLKTWLLRRLAAPGPLTEPRARGFSGAEALPECEGLRRELLYELAKNANSEGRA